MKPPTKAIVKVSTSMVPVALLSLLTLAAKLVISVTLSSSAWEKPAKSPAKVFDFVLTTSISPVVITLVISPVRAPAKPPAYVKYSVS